MVKKKDLPDTPIGVEVDPEKRFATVDEWVTHRIKMGKVVPAGHPAFEPWMASFE